MSSACFHCGEPIPASLSIVSDINGQTEAFCCYGCQAIAEHICGANLAKYYDRRETPAVPLLNKDALNSFKLLEDPALYSTYVHEANDQHTMQVAVTGITCSACAWLIEKHLQSLPGVHSVFVNVTSRVATIVWDPNQLTPADIGQAFFQIGYQARPYMPGEQDQLHQRETKQAIIRLGIAGVGMMQVMMSAIALYAGDIQGMDDVYRQMLRWISFLFATPVALYAGLPFYKGAIRDLKNLHFTMDLPVSIGIVLAYASSTIALLTKSGHVYFDSVTMFIFFLLLGRFLEAIARARQSQQHDDEALSAITVIRNDKLETISLSKLSVGDHVRVLPGQAFPSDGILLSKSASVDESSLTGEYNPVIKHSGDAIQAKTTNVDQTADVEITAIGQNTKAAAIARITERALTEKPAIAILADKVAHYFVFAVLIIAAATYLYWSLQGEAEAYWIMVSVLVVTCPCALSLATPVALTTVTGALKRHGLIITRGHTIEALSKTRQVVFDKTGTLTRGAFSIDQVCTLDDAYSDDELLRLIAGLEQHSTHPIARAFSHIQVADIQQIENIASQGVKGVLEDESYFFGNANLMQELEFELPDTRTHDNGLTLYLAKGINIIGYVVLCDTLRAEAQPVIQLLKDMGIKVSLLTGDSLTSAQSILPQQWFDHYITDCTPDTKWRWLKAQDTSDILMVGDGLNDVPALAGATTSLAMGASSDLAKLHSDAILLSEQLSVIPIAINAAKKCRQIIKQNLFWAVCYNTTLLPAAIAGWIPPWVAAIGMALSSLVVVVNATRLSAV